MATRGRKPQPDAVKAAKGETRPSRTSGDVVEFPSVAAIPEPPAYLNAAGKRLWEEMTPHLFAQRILTIADLYMLGHLCQLHGAIVDQYERRIEPTAADRSQLRMYFGEFGMSPSSRTRIPAAGGEGKTNPFTRNGKKPGADPETPAN